MMGAEMSLFSAPFPLPREKSRKVQLLPIKAVHSSLSTKTGQFYKRGWLRL